MWRSLKNGEYFDLISPSQALCSCSRHSQELRCSASGKSIEQTATPLCGSTYMAPGSVKPAESLVEIRSSKMSDKTQTQHYWMKCPHEDEKGQPVPLSSAYCIFHLAPRHSNAAGATILSAIEADRWKGSISLSLFSFYLRDSICDDERLKAGIYKSGILPKLCK